MKELRDKGIASAMVMSVEETGTIASVIYQNKGEFYIANPVADIEML